MRTGPPLPRFHGVTNDHKAEEIIALNGSAVGGYKMMWDAYTFTEPQPYKGWRNKGGVISSIQQRKKLRFREHKWLAQGHAASKSQSQDGDSALLALFATLDWPSFNGLHRGLQWGGRGIGYSNRAVISNLCSAARSCLQMCLLGSDGGGVLFSTKPIVTNQDISHSDFRSLKKKKTHGSQITTICWCPATTGFLVSVCPPPLLLAWPLQPFGFVSLGLRDQNADPYLKSSPWMLFRSMF